MRYIHKNVMEDTPERWKRGPVGIKVVSVVIQSWLLTILYTRNNLRGCVNEIFFDKHKRGKQL